MSVVPKTYPPELRRDVVTVARRGDLSVAEVAADLAAGSTPQPVSSRPTAIPTGSQSAQVDHPDHCFPGLVDFLTSLAPPGA